jgi:AraC-like DNA-binding protein
LVVWGAPDDAVVGDVFAVARHMFHADIARGRRVLIDCRHVDRTDGSVMVGFVHRARQWVPPWSRSIARQAFVLPPGINGMMIAGTMPAAGAQHRILFTQDLDEAVAFVDHAAARVAHEAATAIAVQARGSSVLLFRVRSVLNASLAGVTIQDVASQLGTSTRSLQRELGRHGSSFSDELRRLRIAAARALLVDSDVKIEAVAAKVGFGTSSRMSAIFRRELAVTPSELRVRARLERNR